MGPRSKTQPMWKSMGLALTIINHEYQPHLVGGWATPLKNMSSSIGMITFPTEWENKKWPPNHHNQQTLISHILTILAGELPTFIVLVVGYNCYHLLTPVCCKWTNCPTYPINKSPGLQPTNTMNVGSSPPSNA